MTSNSALLQLPELSLLYIQPKDDCNGDTLPSYESVAELDDERWSRRRSVSSTSSGSSQAIGDALDAWATLKQRHATSSCSSVDLKEERPKDSSQEAAMSADKNIQAFFETDDFELALSNLSRSTLDLTLSHTTTTDDTFSTNPTSATDSLIDSKVLAAALTFTASQPQAPFASSEPPRLDLPIAIPQIGPGLWMPFGRIYSPVLEQHAVSPNALAAFVDTLNVLCTAYPPLRLLNLAGQLVAIAPSDWCQLAGGLMQIAAAAGLIVLRRKRLREFLEHTNQEFWAPRGLTVKICGFRKLLHVLGAERYEDEEQVEAELQRVESRLQKWKRERRQKKNRGERAIVVPLTELARTKTLNGEEMGVMERRLTGLEGYISPLTFEDGVMPPPTPQTKALQRICDWQVRRDLRMQERSLLKSRKRALKKMHKVIEKAQQKGIEAKVKKNMRRDGEVKASRRVLWLVIENVSDGGDNTAGGETEKQKVKESKLTVFANYQQMWN